MENRLIQKIPLNPPLPKGEDARKDSRQAGMTDGLAYQGENERKYYIPSFDSAIKTSQQYYSRGRDLTVSMTFFLIFEGGSSFMRYFPLSRTGMRTSSNL